MKALNLGVLAHVDAGKTSLSERMLFNVGVLDHMGSVDSGDTHTDSMELEKQRGITIQSSVVSFHLNDTQVNLIDTPGHADFISEVERALAVIDAVVLVVSAVEGIQAQTRILMNTLKRLKKPTLIFVNKVDRSGARNEDLVKEITQQLKVVALPMVRVDDIGTPDASVKHLTTQDSNYYHELMETLCANDEAFLEKCLAQGLEITKLDFIHQLLSTTSQANFCPLYFGSAVTGVGVDELCVGVEHYLPCKTIDSESDPEGVLFKIEKGVTGQKICYVNLTKGQLEARQKIEFHRQTDLGDESVVEKIGDIKVFQEGELQKVKQVTAGNIVCLTGLKQAKIGDVLGEQNIHQDNALFSRPTLETTIHPLNPADRPALFRLLREFAEQDPLISLQQKDDADSICIKLYGEVQQQIIQDRLRLENQIEVRFSDTKMICIERLVKSAEAVHIMDLPNAPLEYYATLGFKIEPGPIDSGIQYRTDGHSGRIPKGFLSVVKESVYTFLSNGLKGWQVTDIIVTLTETGVCPLSLSSHFRQLTPVLLQQALEEAQTKVCEPYSTFELEVPTDLLNTVLVGLKKFDVKVIDGGVNKDMYTVQGEVLTKHVHAIQSLLPGLSQGRSVMISHHGGYV